MAEPVGWTFNPLVAIGIFLAFMFFGYFFGLFEGRGQGYKKRQKEEKEEKQSQPVPLAPTSPPEPSDGTPILNVSMGPDNQLRLKLDGERRDTSALDNEDRKRLIAILTQIRPWLEAPKPFAPASPASNPPRPVSSPKGASPSLGVSSPQGATPPQETPPQKSGIPSLSERIAQVAGTVPPPKPKPAPDSAKNAGQPAPAAKPATPAPDDDDNKPVGEQSIVMQIDSILQARLNGTALEGKGIRLQE